MYNKSNLNKWIKKQIKPNGMLVYNNGYLCDGKIIIKSDQTVHELLSKELKTWDQSPFQWKFNKFEFENDKILNLEQILKVTSNASNKITRMTNLTLLFDKINCRLFVNNDIIAINQDYLDLIAELEDCTIYGGNPTNPILISRNDSRNDEIQLLILPVRVNKSVLKDSIDLLNGATI